MLTKDWAVAKCTLIAPVVLSCVPGTPVWNVAIMLGALVAENGASLANVSPVPAPLQAFTELKQVNVTPAYALVMSVPSATVSKLIVVALAPAAPKSDKARQIAANNRLFFIVHILQLKKQGNRIQETPHFEGRLE